MLVHSQMQSCPWRSTKIWKGSPATSWCWDFGSLVCWQGLSRDGDRNKRGCDIDAQKEVGGTTGVLGEKSKLRLVLKSKIAKR